jgi:PAS domain-containing protein
VSPAVQSKMKTGLLVNIAGTIRAGEKLLPRASSVHVNPSAEADTSFYKTLMENLSEGVYFVNRERVITYWNKGAERLAGYTAPQVVGRNCADNILEHVDEQGQCVCGGG